MVLDFSDGDIPVACQSFKSRAVTWVIFGGKKKIKVISKGLESTIDGMISFLKKEKKEIFFILLRRGTKKVLIFWVGQRKEKSQPQDDFNAVREYFKKYYCSELKVTSTEELEEQKIGETLKSIKSIRTVMFKGVEIFGIRDSWKSIDEAESSQQHRVFPKEKMGLDVLDQMDFADDGNNECNEVSEEELELQDVTEKRDGKNELKVSKSEEQLDENEEIDVYEFLRTASRRTTMP